MADVVCIASWNADLVSRVPRPMARGETLMASHFEISPGGKGSNAAVACARQGAAVAVVARVGSDDFGRMALDLWQQEGMDTRHVEVAEGEPSGVAQILVYDDGDNSIAVAAGAGGGLNAAHAEAARTALQSARVVMAPCEVPQAATMAAFRIAREAGVTTLLNPAPARPLPDDWLALCDLLTPNETEVRTLAGLSRQAPIDEAADALLKRGAQAVLVTLGRAGCALFRRGAEPVRVAGHTMQVTDTIGAGDTFTGTLAAALARGLVLRDAMHWANAAAALSVTGRGAIGGMPTRSAVQALLGPELNRARPA
ncbi:MAG: ribokinase [Acidovorax sp.]